MRIAGGLVKVVLMAVPFLCAAAVLPASAQVQRSGGGANAQLYQDYQQAVAERTQLQGDNAKLMKDLDNAKKQLAALTQQLAAAKAGATTSQAALSAAQASNATTAKNFETLRGQMQELIGRFRETATTLKDVETDRTQLRQQLAQSKAAFDHCAETNYSLYQVDNEVLDRYAHQGVFSRLARAEPFTRLERTRIDNLVLEYRQRADQLRIQRASRTGDAVPDAQSPSAANAKPASSPTPKN